MYMGFKGTRVPRPPLAAFFAAVDKNTVFFSMAAKNVLRGGLASLRVERE